MKNVFSPKLLLVLNIFHTRYLARTLSVFVPRRKNYELLIENALCFLQPVQDIVVIALNIIEHMLFLSEHVF